MSRGVNTSIPWRPCKHLLYPYGYNASVYGGLFTAAYIISAWALTLSVQLRWAVLEPRCVGRTTGRLTLFCVCVSSQVFDKIPSRYGKILAHPINQGDYAYSFVSLKRKNFISVTPLKAALNALILALNDSAKALVALLTKKFKTSS